MSKISEILHILFELAKSGYEFFKLHTKPMTTLEAFEFFAKYGGPAFSGKELMRGQPTEEALREATRHCIVVWGKSRKKTECAAQLIREYYQ